MLRPFAILAALSLTTISACGLRSAAPPVSEQSGPDSFDVAADVQVFSDLADPATAALPSVPGELLVQPFAGASKVALQALYDRVGAIVVDELPEVDLTRIQVQESEVEGVAQKLAGSRLIEVIERNLLFQAQATPDDPMFSRQAALAQIRVPEAWDFEIGHESVMIAIVDSGVAAEHADLAGKVVEGSDAEDETGHGTEVAGVAGAMSDNAEGISGVSWGSPILSVKVTSPSGTATSRDIAAGILRAQAQGARVINVSFAPLWSNSIVRAAAEHAYNRGSLVVISAGNGGGVSAAIGYAEALFVGAVSPSNDLASFSDSGPFVDLVAPGTGIRTTLAGGGYGLVNGTSFAAPLISGVAALCWSTNPDLRPVTIAELFATTAMDLGEEGRDDDFGFGLVDAAAAVVLAADTLEAADEDPPAARIRRPHDGAAIRGRSIVEGTVSDDYGVADVVLTVDGVAVATDVRKPYRFVIDTARFSEGNHHLAVIATDHAGNRGTAESIRVRFSRSTSDVDGISIDIRSPSAGATVSRDVAIEAQVTAAEGLATVEWLVDGVSQLVTPIAGDSSGVSYLWPAASFARGAHVITIIATDTTGMQGFSTIELNRR